jgi:hypothetical protein
MKFDHVVGFVFGFCAALALGALVLLKLLDDLRIWK